MNALKIKFPHPQKNNKLFIYLGIALPQSLMLIFQSFMMRFPSLGNLNAHRDVVRYFCMDLLRSLVSFIDVLAASTVLDILLAANDLELNSLMRVYCFFDYIIVHGGAVRNLAHLFSTSILEPLSLKKSYVRLIGTLPSLPLTFGRSFLWDPSSGSINNSPAKLSCTFVCHFLHKKLPKFLRS